MITIIADTHTHTLATDHAYSTLSENVLAAKAKGLSAIAMTEHTPSMRGGPSWFHFANLGVVPEVIEGITIIKGAEVNIMDYDGALDLEDRVLEKLEWVIAAFHFPCIEPAGLDEHTKAMLAVSKNPLVHVIGHPGDGRYPFDYGLVLRSAKENGKIVEINSHSFKARKGSTENCPKIAKICAALEIPVVVSSDAHHSSRIGEFGEALDMLEAIGFPEKLILNADKERFFGWLKNRNAGIG